MSGPEMDAEARAEVSEAVREALARHGYERLTTARIAAEYDKSEAGLYYYFDSKDEMIAAFLEETKKPLHEELLGVDDAGPERAHRGGWDTQFPSPGGPSAGVAVGIMELLSHAPYNETLRKPLLELESVILERLVEIVESGVEQGVFRPVDPRATAAFLLAAADGTTGFYIALEMDVDEELQAGLSAYIDSLVAE